MNREIYQKFILVNMQAVIVCCIESTRLSDQANKLIDFIFSRFPAKSLKFELLTQFPASSTTCRLLRRAIDRLTLPIGNCNKIQLAPISEGGRLAALAKKNRLKVELNVWREIIKTICHLNDEDEQLVMAGIDDEKRTFIIIGKLANLDQITYAMCSRKLLPEIKVSESV